MGKPVDCRLWEEEWSSGSEGGQVTASLLTVEVRVWFEFFVCCFFFSGGGVVMVCRVPLRDKPYQYLHPALKEEFPSCCSVCKKWFYWGRKHIVCGIFVTVVVSSLQYLELNLEPWTELYY